MMKALEPLVLGQTLTGAGGGGFLVLLTKEPNMADKVRAVIERNKPSDELAFFEASIDLERLTVRVEELGRASCRVCVSPAMNHDTRSN
ncbi:L-fucose kinase-like [Pocillopora damicornis]|uniref:L-fucose kinase-like n=1 Tax=Pocillopora damicornis TaxID=46731 RepID=UPI000F54CB90|nr:L-fucose kinase-like [Pocillopora damicornis]